MTTELNFDGNGLTWGKPLGRSIDPRQVEIARNFLANCKRTKSGNVGSYGLKHAIENWGNTYISNGAAIRAALDLDLIVQPIRHGNPNCLIGVSRASVRRISAASPHRG